MQLVPDQLQITRLQLVRVVLRIMLIPGNMFLVSQAMERLPDLMVLIN